MDINSLYQLYSISRDSPQLLETTSKLLFMPDLFNYFLTGAFASERTIASTSQFYDPVKQCFATNMLRTLGIGGDFLQTCLIRVRNSGLCCLTPPTCVDWKTTRWCTQRRPTILHRQ
jgi:sugar (pentulose or hexulose) kinase